LAGYNRPHRFIFETALKKLGLNPSEAIHVGDLIETDIEGTKAIGMRAAWFNRGGSADRRESPPDFDIDALLSSKTF